MNQFNFGNGENVFFISDTHFYHKNIITFCNRPYQDVDEMNHSLIDNWNNTVNDDSIIFHLGDFAFSNSNAAKEIKSQLKGKIHLILGNHDYKVFNDQTLRNMFEFVGPQLRIIIDNRVIYLNHFPFLCYNNSMKTNWNLHGHVHSGPNAKGNEIGRLILRDRGQYDVGVDNNNYRPISYKEIKEKLSSNFIMNG